MLRRKIFQNYTVVNVSGHSAKLAVVSIEILTEDVLQQMLQQMLWCNSYGKVNCRNYCRWI